MDVKTAFLNDDLEEEIYIEQLEGCVIPRKEKKALGRLSWYNQSPNQDHWTVGCRVLKYLRSTINYGLCFSGFPSVLEGFSDANWISDSDEMKSTNGYVFILGGSVVSWKYAKQTCITRSTMEVEFIALEKTSSEVECLRNLLADILYGRDQPHLCLCIVIAKL
ncbi:Retrovirus-related Pol polyprotein from transposon RE2 [Vitis vinifera]|uniref:Retrovirus-related Pol polyprotein from transposon RE2 n=1 Tax=Vitis vinifera TaxID=29760 RepID=A0A438E168_VITVI|nr:Retrovirus-related Pol polyprotein from transposon RE2 [Vitis vinifera]